MIPRFEQTTAVQRFEPGPGALYGLDSAAHLGCTSRRRILLYCKAGLVHPVVDVPFGILYFDDDMIRAIRRVEMLRDTYGINLTGIKMIFDLSDEVVRLRRELELVR
jgi:DNA-binding transcriptional MerR regulator